MMRNIMFAAALPVAAFLTVATPARAQVVLDLSLVTCGQYLESSLEDKVLISSWLSGYFSAAKNISTIDLRYMTRNQKVVGDYCKSHKSVTLMDAIKKKAK